MSVLDLNALNALPKVERILALAETNAQLEKLDAEGRVAWALENLPGNYVLSSSFGIQAANAQTWFAGLRREQSGSRATLPVLAVQRGVFKVLPIIDWDNRTVYQYLQKHGLKYHPLWDQGYLSVGDTHTTRKWEPGMAEEETRFFGLKRECGLHEG